MNKNRLISRQEAAEILQCDQQATRLYPESESHQLAYKYGYKIALRNIKGEIDLCAINKTEFPILHLLDYIDKQLGEK